MNLTFPREAEYKSQNLRFIPTTQIIQTTFILSYSRNGTLKEHLNNLNIFNTPSKGCADLAPWQEKCSKLLELVSTKLSNRVKCMWSREGILERQVEEKNFRAWISTE